jgi:hypothetical protein
MRTISTGNRILGISGAGYVSIQVTSRIGIPERHELWITKHINVKQFSCSGARVDIFGREGADESECKIVHTAACESTN